MRRPRRIAISYTETQVMCADEVQPEGYEWHPFSYGAHRVYAAAVAAFPDDDVRIFCGVPDQAQALVDELEAFDPDVFGASCYVWSFGTFLEVARLLKARRPDRLVVFGGPCAHPTMFGLAPYVGKARYVDVLVTKEGEDAFTNILALPEPNERSLMTVPGVHVRTPFGFSKSPEPRTYRPLDELPSPFRMGLHPPKFTPHLEMFRGCPLSCAFCEWGVQEDNSRTVSKEWLIEEFETFRRLGAHAVYTVDAGINLSSRAFRALVAAEKETHLLRDVPLVFMAYPDYIRDEHADFLSQIKIRHGSVGLQSTNAEMLARLSRKFDMAKFRHGLKLLTQVAEITVEIILGLPGDNPDSFMRTLNTVLEMDDRVCALAYHCLVLPEGLFTRAPEQSNLVFDPHSLKVISCDGWTEKELRDTHDRVRRLVEQVGGRVGDMWYQLKIPGQQSPHASGKAHEIIDAPGQGMPEVHSGPTETEPERPSIEVSEALGRWIVVATGSRWSFIDATRSERGLLVRLQAGEREVMLDVTSAVPGERHYRVVNGIGWSYRDDGGGNVPEFFRLLNTAIEQSAEMTSELQQELRRAG